MEAAEPLLFSEEELIPWRAEWHNMPEFSHDDLSPAFQVIVNFSCAQDVADFGAMIGQNIRANAGRQLQSVWFVEQEIGRMTNKRYKDVSR